jgi:hypothetical protein
MACVPIIDAVIKTREASILLLDAVSTLNDAA